MWPYVLLGVTAASCMAVIALRARRALCGGKLGDFVRVPIPRSIQNGPLAMGTRLEVAAALKKAGHPLDEIRRLLDTSADDQLLERYWALQDSTRSSSTLE